MSKKHEIEPGSQDHLEAALVTEASTAIAGLLAKHPGRGVFLLEAFAELSKRRLLEALEVRRSAVSETRSRARQASRRQLGQEGMVDLSVS